MREDRQVPILHRDMTLCISLAARPSNLGTRFHNYCYDELGLPYVYKAFTTTDLEGAIRGVRALGIRGCSVSMPFKEAVIDLVDELLPSAAAIASVNTVVHDLATGRLVASNTDHDAVLTLLGRHAVDPAARVVVRGSGGMAKAVVAAFRAHGTDDLTVLARNEAAGRALAEAYGYTWTDREPTGDEGFAVLANVTPLGMDGPDAGVQAYDDRTVAAAATVLDVVALPAETPLVRAARAAGRPVVTGAEVVALQAALQFEAYTGVALDDDLVARASAFSRQSA